MATQSQLIPRYRNTGQIQLLIPKHSLQLNQRKQQKQLIIITLRVEQIPHLPILIIKIQRPIHMLTTTIHLPERFLMPQRYVTVSVAGLLDYQHF